MTSRCNREVRRDQQRKLKLVSGSIQSKPSLASFWWRRLLLLSLPPTTLLLTVAGVITATAETVTRTPSRSERRPSLSPVENDVVGITTTLPIPIPIPIPIPHPPSPITPGSASNPCKAELDAFLLIILSHCCSHIYMLCSDGWFNTITRLAALIALSSHIL